MSEKKMIAVVGATGAQGGGLARAALNAADAPFSVRAVTRNPKSEKAEDLARLGAEVVQADLDDLESLKRAFSGAAGAYCVTSFWEHVSPEKELAQAKNLAEAAGAAGVEHVIWSTLENTRKWMSLDDDRMPTLMKKYKVPHFDAKGEADEFFEKGTAPATLLRTSFYWDNFIHFGMGPQRGPDGVLGITLPMGDKRLPGIAAEDIGKCAYGIFKEGDAYRNRAVGIAGDMPTGARMAAVLTKVLGEEIRYNDVPPEVYRSFDFPGADDLGNMFQFKRDFNADFCGARSVEESRKLNPELQDLETWAKRNKDRIPVPAGEGHA